MIQSSDIFDALAGRMLETADGHDVAANVVAALWPIVAAAEAGTLPSTSLEVANGAIATLIVALPPITAHFAGSPDAITIDHGLRCAAGIVDACALPPEERDGAKILSWANVATILVFEAAVAVRRRRIIDTFEAEHPVEARLIAAGSSRPAVTLH